MTAIGWAAGLGGAGAIVGSFTAALVLRWPEGQSVMRGRSRCDTCGRTLRPIELIPILSFLIQRGRCRHCRAAIDPRHLGIELIALASGGVAGAVAPGLEGIAGAVFAWLLLALAALDLAAFWLPDRLTGTLAIAGLVTGVLGVVPPIGDRLIGGVAGFGVLTAIAWAYRLYRGREGMGGGDPKLLGAIGLWLGWRMLPAVLVIASLVGLGVALFAHLTGRRMAGDTALPFGALLGVAAYPAWIAMIVFAP